MSDWHEYERLKAKWQADNPGATSQQYQSAMRAIANRLGL